MSRFVLTVSGKERVGAHGHAWHILDTDRSFSVAELLRLFDASEKMWSALMVICNDPQLVEYFESNDPQALQQAKDALHYAAVL